MRSRRADETSRASWRQARLLAAVGLASTIGYGPGVWYPYGVARARPRTHDEVTVSLAGRHRSRLKASVEGHGLRYPPTRLTLVGLKEERLLEAWAPAESGWKRIRSYPVLAASGGAGPKLRQGDLQVPEGFYRLTGFNPNSSYHLSVRVGYPNREDEAVARAEGRTRLGGDIFIHGRAVWIGCLAIGDPAIEELYLLLADVGLARSRLILAPSGAPRAAADAPAWLRQLYQRLREELRLVRGRASGPVRRISGPSGPVRQISGPSG